MENNEIYIDGINVAGCEYYIQDYQRANNIEGRYEHCKDVCELNGDNYFYCKMNKNCYYKQLKRLEQENKELKNEINKLGKKHEDYCNTMYWQMKEQMDKYRSALEEIKSICSNQDLYRGRQALATKLLQLITEVLQ